MSFLISPIVCVAEMVRISKLPISPRVGETSGRTEGDAKDRNFPAFLR